MIALSMNQSLLDEIVRQSRAAYPREAVGLLGGPTPLRLTAVFPLTNIANDDHEFLADPFEQWQALNRMKEQNLQACAVFHSHPDGGVDLSAQDRRFAGRSGLAQVLIALTRDSVRLAAYAVEGHAIMPLAIVAD